MKKNIIKLIISLVIINLSLVIAQGQSWKELDDSVRLKIKIPASPNITDSKGLKQGQWTYMNDLFLNSTEDSSRFEYYQILNYIDGKPSGLIKAFYLTGEIKCEYFMLSEDPPVFDSTYVYYYKNGQVQQKGSYKNGVPAGIYESWWENGNLCQRINYQNGLFSGKYEWWHENGKIWMEGMYINGNWVGEWKYWNDDGTEDLVANANVFMNMNDFARADSSFRIAANLYKQKYGENHPYYAKLLAYQGGLFQRTMNYKAAETCLMKAIEIFDEKYQKNNREYLLALNNIAKLFIELGRYKEAEPVTEKAIDWCRKNGGLNEDYAGLLTTAGLIQFQLSNYSRADSLMKESQRTYKSLSGENSIPYSIVLGDLSVLYSSMEKNDEALALAKKSFEIQKEKLPGNHPDLKLAYNNLGTIYFNMGKYYEAIELNNKSIELDSNFDVSYHNLSTVYERMGKYNEADSIMKRAIHIIKGKFGENHFSYAKSIEGLAIFYMNLSRYSEADSLLRLSLSIKKKIYDDNSTEITNTLTNQSSLYQITGRFRECEELSNQLLEIVKERFGENNKAFATALGNLSQVYEATGRYRDAEEMLKKSVEIKKRLYGENHDFYASSLADLSSIYYRRGRYNEAEAIIIKALEILKSKFGEKHLNHASGVNKLGLIYMARGKYTDALQLFQKSLEIQKSISGDTTDDYSFTLNNIGLVLLSTGKYGEAESYFLKSMKIVKSITGEKSQNFANISRNMGQIYVKTNRYDEAEASLKQSLEIVKSQFGELNMEYVATIGILAGIYSKMDRFNEAEPLFDKTIQIVMEIVQKNFPYMNEQQKIDFWGLMKGGVSAYNEFVSYYYRTKPEMTTKMAEITLDTKGIVLNSTQKALSKMRYSSRLLEDWQNTRQFWLHLVQNPQKAKKMGINVDSVGQVASDLEKEISSQSLDFRKAFDTTRVRWGDVRNALANNQAAVEIIRNQPKTDSVRYMILITKKDSKIPELIVLNNGRELEEIHIKKYASLIEKQRNGLKLNKDDLQSLGMLYNQFWKPVQEKLQGINSVFISMDGVYNEFNPNTLMNPENEKYVLDEIDLRFVTSTRDIARTNKSPASSMGKLKGGVVKLFGDPQFELNKEVNVPVQDTTGLSRATRNYYLGGILNFVAQRGISPLPGTKVEIKKISNDFSEKKWKVEDFTGDAALEENVKLARNPKILHIATHGVFLKDVEYMSQELEFENKKYVENPLLRSMLLFAGAENTIRGETGDNLDRDDGILTAYEAMNLDLDNTELVVLSACETGLGEVRNGEGVYGLQRAFQVAGAKSLIMSLWSVSDEATQELMTSFYNKWLSGRTKREAFREAQMELKKKYPGFYYWGAFVMVGE